MLEEEIRNIIRYRINFRINIDEEYPKYLYDGFDMSGYGNSFMYNLELILRFKDLIKNFHRGTSDDWRNANIWLPHFWKGSGELKNLAKCNQVFPEQYHYVGENDLGGDTTENILFKIITKNNPSLIK